jgi:hypothetical protein
MQVARFLEIARVFLKTFLAFLGTVGPFLRAKKLLRTPKAFLKTSLPFLETPKTFLKAFWLLKRAPPFLKTVRIWLSSPITVIPSAAFSNDSFFYFPFSLPYDAASKTDFSARPLASLGYS